MLSNFNLDKEKKPQIETCIRCEFPINKTRSHFTHVTSNQNDELNQKLCKRCSKRDNDFFFAINNCIRLYGHLITIFEIFELYSNKNVYKKLYFDPFRYARAEHDRDDPLKMKDFDRWIEFGIFEKSKNNTLTIKAQEEREKIKNQINEKADHDIPKSKGNESNGSDSLNRYISRLKKEGGAAKGKERWKKTK